MGLGTNDTARRGGTHRTSRGAARCAAPRRTAVGCAPSFVGFAPPLQAARGGTIQNTNFVGAPPPCNRVAIGQNTGSVLYRPRSGRHPPPRCAQRTSGASRKRPHPSKPNERAGTNARTKTRSRGVDGGPRRPEAAATNARPGRTQRFARYRRRAPRRGEAPLPPAGSATHHCVAQLRQPSPSAPGFSPSVQSTFFLLPCLYEYFTRKYTWVRRGECSPRQESSYSTIFR